MGTDPNVCQQHLDDCVGTTTTTPTVDCQTLYADCIADGQPQDFCDQLLQDCENPPTTTTPDCQMLYDDCITTGQPQDFCDQVLQDCENPPTTTGNACDKELQDCLNAGTDPQTCNDAYVVCLESIDSADTGH
ncbi:MAG: hypothetical protein R3F59_35525 [Myxococcota bacterium]